MGSDEAKRQPLERVSPTAAIVYPIVLPDRLELLVGLPTGVVERHTVPVGAEALTSEVRSFRTGLQARTTDEYRAPAGRLYDWLVRPYADGLGAQRIDTLVFVPDGALRTIPFAALHDGERFAIERFAVAVTPGLTLVEPHPLAIGQARLLLAGVSEPVQGFPALPQVATELEAIHDLYDGELLLDDAFRAERVEAEVAETRPGVVHLATHAVFTGDAQNSYLLTHDGRLTMERLGQIVGRARFGEEPLEFLTLSACETAASDDRAALGLSGVAVRAGARSALGSLWAVVDKSTAALLVDFYRELEGPGLSKAKALQRAQLELQRNPRFAHPFYWAGFLLISNWL